MRRRLGEEAVKMYLSTSHYCEKICGFLGICDRSTLLCKKRSLYCVDFTVCVCPHVCVHAFPVSFTLHMLLECTCTCHRSCVKLYDFQWLSVVYSHSSSWVFMTELLPTRNTFYFRRACVFLPICVHVPKLRGLTWWAKDVVFAQCT